MIYYTTKNGQIIDDNNQLIPMDESSSLYQDYYNYLANDGTVYESDYILPSELLDIQTALLSLHVEYPETTAMPYKFIQLDNLEGIERDAALSNKGLKGEKKYFKNGTLIFSSQKKYWFELDAVYTDGFIRTLKVFNVLGNVIDAWEVKVKLSDDDKQQFRKQQRELIFDYFKSQQTQLFNFLYAYFAKEINDYVILGGSALADTLINAIDNHPSPEVRGTLASLIPTQSGQTIRVLDGILYELV